MQRSSGREVLADTPLLMDESGNLSEAKTDPDVRFVEVDDVPNATSTNNGEASAGFFGGAIKCALPSSFSDVSEVRQVPDNQEVWMDMDNGLTMILELLEFEHSFEGKGHSAAQEQELVMRHIFDDITATSEAQAHVIDKVLVSEDMGSVTANTPIVRKLQEFPQAILTARHAVQQRSRPSQAAVVEMDGVCIISVNVRLQPVDTDLVLTMYMTQLSRVSTSDADSIINRMEPLGVDSVLADTALLPESLPSVVQEGIRVLRRIVGTLEIEDWSLFTP